MISVGYGAGAVGQQSFPLLFEQPGIGVHAPLVAMPHTSAHKTSHHPRDAQAHIALKAAAEGDEAAVLAFLDSGGDVNAKSKTGARCGDP